jgi:hypothetical protein
MNSSNQEVKEGIGIYGFSQYSICCYHYLNIAVEEKK